MMTDFEDCDLSAWQEEGVVIVIPPKTGKKKRRAVRRAPWSTVVVGAAVFASSLCTPFYPESGGIAVSQATEPFIADGRRQADSDFMDAARWKTARAHVRSLPARVDDDSDPDSII
jgi:hypothetical protein